MLLAYTCNICNHYFSVILALSPLMFAKIFQRESLTSSVLKHTEGSTFLVGCN